MSRESLGVALLFLIGSAVARPAGAATDPFTAYLGSSPKVVESLTSVVSGSGDAAVVTTTFTLQSRAGTNAIYAIESAPQKAGRYPGLLVLHGGGGNADTVAGTAKTLAQRGYVTLAIDLPHLCQPNCSAKTTGPWRSRPLGEAPRFEVVPGPEQSVLFDAELAGVDAFNWLRAQANVDADNMGIFGFSWGGYSTTFLSSLLGDKVKAAYAVFGCGFYDEGSFWKDRIAQLSAADRDLWLATYDAGRRAAGMKAAYFLEGESNDTYFWPEAVQATIDAIPANANHVWGPNLNHHQLASGPQMIQLHLDYYLKGIGAPFVKARVAGITQQVDQSKSVTLDLDVPEGVSVSSVQLYYSTQSDTWQERTWSALDATASGATRYVASLSSQLAGQALDFYGLVTDARGVATSTSMYDSSSVVPLEPGGGGAASGGSSGTAGGAGDTTRGGFAGAAGAPAGGALPSSGGQAGGSAPAGLAGGGSGGVATSPTMSGVNPASNAGCTCSVRPVVAPPGLGFFALSGSLLVLARRTLRICRRRFEVALAAST